MTDTTSDFGTYVLEGWKRTACMICNKLGTSWLGLRIAFILRKVVLLNLPTGIVDIERDHLKIRFYPLDNVSDRFFLFMPQFFDVAEQEFMKQSLKTDSTFVDIGGNSGFYALFASRHIKKGKILTFEPHPEMVQRLRYNIRTNQLSGRITVKAFGIADKEKSYNLSVNPNNLGGNSIVLTHAEKSDYLQKQIEVSCRPLLQVLKEENVQHIDLLKIDIEEAEHLALIPFFENSHKSLFPKHIIIETDDKIDLKAYGYVKRFTTNSRNAVYSLKSHG